MNIMYCGDKNIEEGLALSVLSLLRNVREPLCVYVLTVDTTAGDRRLEPVSQQTADKLQTIVRRLSPDGFVRIIDVTALFEEYLPVANLATRFTPCCMLRLFADLIGDIPDRILYLDNDVICRRDISEFYRQPLDGCEFVGVLDFYGSWFFRNRFWKRDYVNSGVMLMNIPEIRSTGLFERCRIRCRDVQMFMPDQSSLNKLSERKRIAPRRYNEQRRLHKNTVMQHFTTSFRAFPYPRAVSVKPWQVDRVHNELRLHEYDDLLKEYLNYKNQGAPQT